MINKATIENEIKNLFKELIDEEEDKIITNPIETEFKVGKLAGLDKIKNSILVDFSKATNLPEYATFFIGDMKKTTEDFIKQRSEFTGSIKEKGVLFGKIAGFENYKNFVVELSSRLAKEAYNLDSKGKK